MYSINHGVYSFFLSIGKEFAPSHCTVIIVWKIYYKEYQQQGNFKLNKKNNCIKKPMFCGKSTTLVVHVSRLAKLMGIVLSFFSLNILRGLSGRVLDSIAGSSLTSVTALCPWASLVLVQPRKTRPFITERLLMGYKESNQTSTS